MAKKESNENYCHSCEKDKVNIHNYLSPIFEAQYTLDEFKHIIDFYLLHAPVLKSDSPNLYGLKNLKDYGWCGTADMSKLERELLKTSKNFIGLD